MQVREERRPLVKITPIHGELEFLGEQYNDSYAFNEGGDKRDSEVMLLQETLELNTSGDVYHPDLMSFWASMGFGLLQQRSELDEVKDSGSGDMPRRLWQTVVPWPVSRIGIMVADLIGHTSPSDHDLWHPYCTEERPAPEPYLEWRSSLGDQ